MDAHPMCPLVLVLRQT